eukprot:12910566-Alexandrium_andersonii.AAC.1
MLLAKLDNITPPSDAPLFYKQVVDWIGEAVYTTLDPKLPTLAYHLYNTMGNDIHTLGELAQAKLHNC